ncbi:MAG TPA: hypothetical protein VFM05_03540 [Candidatus Saccharimonadales bacterium]|nr:hypothetical protein [Candidatus Saccharimonadales bacterium]
MTPAFVLSASLSVLTIFGFAFFAVLIGQLVAWFSRQELTTDDRKVLKWTAAFVAVDLLLLVVR